MLKNAGWLMAVLFMLAVGLSACQPKQEQPAPSTTTNTAQPAKAPEHPEHPK